MSSYLKSFILLNRPCVTNLFFAYPLRVLTFSFCYFTFWTVIKFIKFIDLVRQNGQAQLRVMRICLFPYILLSLLDVSRFFAVELFANFFILLFDQEAPVDSIRSHCKTCRSADGKCFDEMLLVPCSNAHFVRLVYCLNCSMEHNEMKLQPSRRISSQFAEIDVCVTNLQ